MTRIEANDILNYFAEETPELYWRVKLLKDELRRREETTTGVITLSGEEPLSGEERGFYAYIVNAAASSQNEIESHAIAFAIAAALKEQGR